MNNPKLIGITGGIGAGKSTVARIFNLLGVPVYDADQEARGLMVHDSDIVESIINAFGKKSYSNGELNRAWLAKEVFNSEEATKRINAIVHPAVAKHFEHWTNQQSTSYILKEAALLFETGSYSQLHATILITAPVEVRISRIKARDPQRPVNQISEIIAKQMPVEQALKLADYTLQNDGQHLLIPQVIALHNKLIQ